MPKKKPDPRAERGSLTPDGATRIGADAQPVWFTRDQTSPGRLAKDVWSLEGRPLAQILCLGRGGIIPEPS